MKFNTNYKSMYLALLAGPLMAGSAINTAVAETVMLEEIMLTAQKRTESVQDIPVSISAITGDALEKMKMDTAVDIPSQVPNMQVSTPFGEVQPIFSIRGISMVDTQTNQVGPIGVYVDEVAAGPSFMQGMQLFDLERVEVLRGPQGTLYGKNTTAGAVNFITSVPSFNPEAYLTASVGSYGRRQLKGAAEVVLIEDTLGVRAAFSSTKVDGYFDNRLPGHDDMSETDNQAYRLTTRYQGEAFGATLRLFKGESDGNSPGIVMEGTYPGGVNGFGYKRQDSWDAWEGEINRDAPYKTDVEGVALT
jgi:iron complex outermembrane receptor protein